VVGDNQGDNLVNCNDGNSQNQVNDPFIQDEAEEDEVVNEAVVNEELTMDDEDDG